MTFLIVVSILFLIVVSGICFVITGKKEQERYDDCFGLFEHRKDESKGNLIMKALAWIILIVGAAIFAALYL